MQYTTNTNVKPKIEADPSLIANIENETYKPRQHPGIIKPRTVSLPPNIMKAIEIILQGSNCFSTYFTINNVRY